MSTEHWTVGRGEGHRIRIIVKEVVRGFHIGFSADMLDADTGDFIGGGILCRDHETCLEDAKKLTGLWWPGAEVVL